MLPNPLVSPMCLFLFSPHSLLPTFEAKREEDWGSRRTDYLAVVSQFLHFSVVADDSVTYKSKYLEIMDKMVKAIDSLRQKNNPVRLLIIKAWKELLDSKMFQDLKAKVPPSLVEKMESLERELRVLIEGLGEFCANSFSRNVERADNMLMCVLKAWNVVFLKEFLH